VRRLAQTLIGDCRQGTLASSAPPRGLKPGSLVTSRAGREKRAERAQFMQSLTVARHSQLMEALRGERFATLGVATEGMPSSGRSHDFMYVEVGSRSQPMSAPDETNCLGRCRQGLLMGSEQGQGRLRRRHLTSDV